MEDYLVHEKIPNPANKADAIFLPGAKFLPEPKTPYLMVEQEILIPEEDFGTKKPLYGFLDATVLHHIDEHGDAWLLVYDGKTTSDLKYAKSEEELRNDPQALIYCWAARQLTIGALGYAPTKIRFSHVYFRTRGAPASMKAYVDFTVEELQAGLAELAKACHEMARWDGKPFDQVPANINACGAYGGCHLRPECAKTGLLVYGDSPEAVAAAQLRTTRMDKETTMGILSNKSLAALAVKAVLPPSAPVSDDINPPDGDVHGVSGTAIDPSAQPETDDEAVQLVAPDASPAEQVEDTATAEVVEESPREAPVTPAAQDAIDAILLDAAEQAPMQLPALLEQPNPDQGYTETPAVASKIGAKGRPSEKPALWDRVEDLLQQLRDDPVSWKRAQAITHEMVSKIISGKVKLRANNINLEDVREIVKILEAATANDMQRLAAPPAAASNTDPLAALQTARDQHQAALVAAKGALAAAMQHLRVLDEKRADTLADEDEDAYTKYNAEVYLPARKRVQAGEAQLKEAEQTLADAIAERKRKEEEARAAKERAAEEAQARNAAQAQVAQVESKAADVSQLVALGTLKEQPIGGRKHGCILLKGCTPTRKHKTAAVHIDDLINPYRLAMETAAMTAYYKSTAKGGDPATRICEEILLALRNGTLQLPVYLTAPAHSNPLQNAVIDALSPYFEDVFGTLS